MRTTTIDARTVRGLLPVLLVLASCATSRATDVELEQIRAALELRPGTCVADVGAGDGEWSEGLARQVGESGHVFATEVKDERVESIRRRAEREGLGNVTVVLGNQQRTGLPDDCCDAILLRLSYHHFTDPERMRAALRAALRPGGLLAIVEITPQSGWARLPDVPERDGHGISPEGLLEEMESDGWVAVARHDAWGTEKDHYCIVFR